MTLTYRIWQHWNLQYVCLPSASNGSRAQFSLLSLMRDRSEQRNYADDSYMLWYANCFKTRTILSLAWFMVNPLFTIRDRLTVYLYFNLYFKVLDILKGYIFDLWIASHILFNDYLVLYSLTAVFLVRETINQSEFSRRDLEIGLHPLDSWLATFTFLL